MGKQDTCGTEVGAKELAVVLRRQEVLQPSQSFPNTAEGHQALIRYLRRAGRVVQVCLESTGLYGLDLALALSGQEEIEVMVANPRAARLDPRREDARCRGGRLIGP
jgi:transposase